jgi:hypothetical protein
MAFDVHNMSRSVSALPNNESESARSNDFDMYHFDCFFYRLVGMWVNRDELNLLSERVT